MSEHKNIEKTKAFYYQLFSKASTTIAIIIIVAIIDLWLLPLLDTISWLPWSILVLALLKIFFIVRLSFDQLMKIIGQSHLLSHILVLFGLLISLIIVSFATDFTALHYFSSQNFKTAIPIGSTGIIIFFEYFYFSTITFSSVGYGDIVPISILSKILIILEVALRFFVLVFGIANINQIRINDNQTQ